MTSALDRRSGDLADIAFKGIPVRLAALLGLGLLVLSTVLIPHAHGFNLL
jgi:hypothetical protein